MTCLKRPKMLRKEGEAEGVTSTQRPLDITRTQEVQDMPNHVGNIGSTESASNTPKDNWQSIGELAARLVRK